jgi:tRNA (guanine37-N1)-methyltransferase
VWLGLVSLFPEMFRAVTEYGITGRAVERGLLELDYFNPRDYTTDRHRTVDDKPYGGGPGMLMKVQPLKDAIAAARDRKRDGKVIYLSPQGKRLDQQILKDLSKEDALILVSGRYEGVDERLIEQEVDLELSIGDYVLSGGELAAMVVADGITRLLPGAVGDEESIVRDSFYDGLLDYPQYTRPTEIEGQSSVPEVLLSGDHAEIARWRMKQALGRTFERRPDLLAKQPLDDEGKQLLQDYLNEKTK